MIAVARADMHWGDDVTDKRAMKALEPHKPLTEKYYKIADAVLATVQSRVESLPRFDAVGVYSETEGEKYILHPDKDGSALQRDDVLRIFGAG